jgi:hypothetical protein
MQRDIMGYSSTLARIGVLQTLEEGAAPSYPTIKLLLDSLPNDSILSVISIVINYSLDDIKLALSKSVDLADMAFFLGGSKKSYRFKQRIKNDLIRYNLDFSHLHSQNKNKSRRKRQIINKLCPVCLKEFKTILSGNKHEKQYCSRACCNKLNLGDRHSKNTLIKVSNSLKKQNKITTIKLTCKICNNTFYITNKQKSKITCSSKCRGIYFSNKSKAGEIDFSNTGGYREKSGRGRYGWYKGYYCASSWELAWVIYNLDNKIKFERNLKGFEYFFNGKTYKYYPDFYIPDTDEYIEIKGFINDKTLSKIEQFPKKITILYKNEMKSIIDYVVDKYGKDYIQLYE